MWSVGLSDHEPSYPKSLSGAKSHSHRLGLTIRFNLLVEDGVEELQTWPCVFHVEESAA